MSVSGGSVTEATISELIQSTSYFIEVATVNSAGTGMYNNPSVITETPAQAPSKSFNRGWVYLC